MALHLNTNRSLGKKRLVGALIAIFALVAQPLYGVIAGQVANALSDLTPEVTKVDSYYSVGDGYTGVGIDFTIKNVGNEAGNVATNLELILLDSEENEYSIKATSKLINELNDTPVEATFSRSGTVVITGFRASSSQSWEDMTGTWAGSSLPVKALVCVTLADVETPVCSEDNAILERTGQTQNDVFAAVPEITHAEAYYTFESDYTAISVDFYTKSIVDAEGIELRVNRSDSSTYSITAKDSVVNSIKTVGSHVTSGPIVITGSRHSDSWNNQTGTWSGESRPESVDVIIYRENAEPLIKHIDIIGETMATMEQVFAEVPTLSVAAHFIDNEKYGGISLEIEAPNLTDAESVEVTVEREPGTPDVWTNRTSTPIDGLIGSTHTTTAPIVIVEKERTRAYEGSWQTSSEPWTEGQKPTSVTVRITRSGDGEDLIQTLDLISNAWGVEWEQIAEQVDSSAPTMSNINLFVNGKDTDIAKSGDTLRIVADVEDSNGVDRVEVWVRDWTTSTPRREITAGKMSKVDGDTYQFEFTLPETYTNGDPINQTIDGNYFNFRPYDKKGNSHIGWRNNFSVDNESPVISDLSIDRSVTNESTIRLIGKVFDPNLKDYNVRVFNSDKSGLVSPFIGASGTESSEEIRTLATLDISSLADGKYWVRIWADDYAGNRTGINSHIYIPFIVDRKDPKARITSHNDGDQVYGIIELIGEVEDNNPMNSHFKITGPGNYSKSNTKYDGRREHKFVWDVSGLPNGEYTIQFETRDLADNKSDLVSIKKIKLIVNNPQPVVVGENFNTHSGDDYKGFNVGFNIANFSTVTGITVQLFGDDSDNPLVENTAYNDLLDLINNDGLTQLSTPFFTIPGTYDEEYWDLGSYDWTTDSPRPIRAEVIVTGTNNLGEEVTKTATLTNLTEPNGWTFESILPEEKQGQEEGKQSQGGEQGNSSHSVGGSSSNGFQNLNTPTPLPAASLFANIFPQPITPPADNLQNEGRDSEAENREVLGEQDNEDGTPLEDTSEVLGTASNGLLGLAWYWWIVIIAALVGAWLAFAAVMRRRKAEADL